MRSSLRLAALLPVASLLFGLTACGPTYSVSDNIDDVFDLAITPSDTLSLPYVLGTTVTINARGFDDDELSRVSVRSEDESRLHTVSNGSGSTTFQALEEGIVTVDVMLDGDVVHTAEVEIKAPTRATVTPRGELLVGAEVSPIDGAHVMVNGTATFLVEYFAGDERLFGNGVLDPEATGSVEATNLASSFLETREWLQVTPDFEGAAVVKLVSSGQDLGSFKIDGVDPSVIDDVVLEAESPNGDDNESLVVLAHSLDKSGGDVLGVDFEWEIDGQGQDGEGDLLEYTFNPDDTQTVTAAIGGKQGSVDIHEEPGSAFVTSSNAVGCSIGSGERGSETPFVAFAGAIGLAALVRRSRRSRR